MIPLQYLTKRSQYHSMTYSGLPLRSDVGPLVRFGPFLKIVRYDVRFLIFGPTRHEAGLGQLCSPVHQADSGQD